MLQNLNNNYYTNFAGVLFTMPTSGDINNATVPSDDPALISGPLTIQGLSGAQRLAPNNQSQRSSNLMFSNPKTNQSFIDRDVLPKEDLTPSIALPTTKKTSSSLNRSTLESKKIDMSKIKITKKQIIKPANAMNSSGGSNLPQKIII